MRSCRNENLCRSKRDRSSTAIAASTIDAFFGSRIRRLRDNGEASLPNYQEYTNWVLDNRFLLQVNQSQQTKPEISIRNARKAEFKDLSIRIVSEYIRSIGRTDLDRSSAIASETRKTSPNAHNLFWSDSETVKNWFRSKAEEIDSLSGKSRRDCFLTHFTSADEVFRDDELRKLDILLDLDGTIPAMLTMPDFVPDLNIAQDVNKAAELHFQNQSLFSKLRKDLIGCRGMIELARKHSMNEPTAKESEVWNLVFKHYPLNVKSDEAEGIIKICAACRESGLLTCCTDVKETLAKAALLTGNVHFANAAAMAYHNGQSQDLRSKFWAAIFSKGIKCIVFGVPSPLFKPFLVFFPREGEFERNSDKASQIVESCRDSNCLGSDHPLKVLLRSDQFSGRSTNIPGKSKKISRSRTDIPGKATKHFDESRLSYMICTNSDGAAGNIFHLIYHPINSRQNSLLIHHSYLQETESSEIVENGPSVDDTLTSAETSTQEQNQSDGPTSEPKAHL